MYSYIWMIQLYIETIWVIFARSLPIIRINNFYYACLLSYNFFITIRSRIDLRHQASIYLFIVRFSFFLFQTINICVCAFHSDPFSVFHDLVIHPNFFIYKISFLNYLFQSKNIYSDIIKKLYINLRDGYCDMRHIRRRRRGRELAINVSN